MKKRLLPVFAFLLLVLSAIIPLLLTGCTKETEPDPEPDPELPIVVEPWETLSGNYWMHCYETDSNPDTTIIDDHGYDNLAVLAPNDSIVMILGDTLFFVWQPDTTMLRYNWHQFGLTTHYLVAKFYFSQDSLEYVDGYSSKFTGGATVYEGRKMEGN